MSVWQILWVESWRAESLPLFFLSLFWAESLQHLCVDTRDTKCELQDTNTHFFIVVNNYFVNVISSNVLTLCILSK